MNIKKFFLLSSILFLFIISSNSFLTEASDADKVFGQAWSSNIGWISFNNCTSPTSCSGISYGVTTDSNGNLSGAAWSTNVGWLNFNETSGCPISGCTTQPKVDLTTGVFSGWARFTSNGGGWDGWVNLSGLTANTSTGIISGHAWGGDVVGWIAPISMKIYIGIPTPGGWSDWQCSLTSGYEIRHCDNPTPANGGAECTLSTGTGTSETRVSTNPACGTITPVSIPCLNGDSSCTVINGTCSNGAVNPTLCTIDINGHCLNGKSNPPACTKGKYIFKEN